VGEVSVPARLSVVTLGVGDFATMRAFYRGLGWETRSTSDDFAAFPLGGAVLALYPVAALAGEAALPPTPLPQPFRGFSLAITVETEEAVDAAVEAVRRAGGRVLAEPVGRDWGGRSGYFADPEGNVWEVAYLPGGTFDERGALIWPW
jgi:uncharacterized protein